MNGQLGLKLLKLLFRRLRRHRDPRQGKLMLSLQAQVPEEQ